MKKSVSPSHILDLPVVNIPPWDDHAVYSPTTIQKLIKSNTLISYEQESNAATINLKHERRKPLSEQGSIAPYSA
jgi:hypothetical protein